MVSHPILDELYDHGEFKSGHSRRADEALANVIGTLRTTVEGDHFTYDDFWRAWQALLEVLPEELPNVSPHNLAMLSTPLASRRLAEEELTALLLLETIAPTSVQGQCMLANAHQKCGNLDSAALHFRKAYECAMQQVRQNELEPTHPLRLDASDYLRYLAEVEVKRNRCAQAMVAAIQALQIVKKTGAVFKEGDAYDTLYRVCLAMRLDTLAETYCQRAEEARARKH